MTQAAPGHIEEVRRLVLDPLTLAQYRRLREISRRIMDATEGADRHPDD